MFGTLNPWLNAGSPEGGPMQLVLPFKDKQVASEKHGPAKIIGKRAYGLLTGQASLFCALYG